MTDPDSKNKRRYKRLFVNDSIALTPQGVCQLANLNADGISFRCVKEGSFPAEWQMDIYDSRGLSLEKVKVKKIWEKGLVLLPGKDAGLLYKIAGDLFVSHTRRDKLRQEAPERIRFESGSRTPEEELELLELQEKYEKALVKLPENQRIVFLMSRMEELTYSEIAARLTISVKAVEKRMTGALARLRKEIKT